MRGLYRRPLIPLNDAKLQIIIRTCKFFPNKIARVHYNKQSLTNTRLAKQHNISYHKYGHYFPFSMSKLAYSQACLNTEQNTRNMHL